MKTITRRLITVAAALALVAVVAADANACCGASGYTAGYAPYTSYYSPGYTTAYAPSYSTYYGGGWYPGYWADRIRTRLWGSPTTYVAGYAGYATSYAPAPACSTCQPSYGVSYAPAACSSCSPCSSCPTCTTAAYAPSCDTCSGCSTCGTVTQAGYAPSNCSNCNAQPAAMQQQPQPNTVIAPPGTTVIQQNGVPAAAEPAPSLSPGQSQPQSTFRPEDNSKLQPSPQPESNSPRPEYDPNKKTESSTYLEAPKLFNPNDRTAGRSIAPVHNALYKQPVGFRTTSTAPVKVTAEQAELQAAGWTSAN